MILIVYDPDIAVFAERCLHDGDASAINSSIVSSDNTISTEMMWRTWK